MKRPAQAPDPDSFEQVHETNEPATPPVRDEHSTELFVQQIRETADKLLLTLGNASVKMKVNGKDVPVSESPNSIGLLLQPAGTRPLPPSKQPTCA